MNDSIKLNVNSDELKAFTKRLETLPRQAFPSAVRATLNGAAFDVKKRTLPQSAKDNFVERQANFFKANSTVDKATGWNVDTMQSMVGMYDNKLVDKKDNYAVRDLEQQEHGGTIGGKSFIAMKTARISGSTNRNVKTNFRLSMIIKDRKNVLDAKRNKALTKKQKFIKTAITALKEHPNNAFVLGNTFNGGQRTLSRIDSIRFNRQSKKVIIKRTPLYTFRHGRKITVAGKNFMKRAAHETTLIMDVIYSKEAIYQFKKHLKK